MASIEWVRELGRVLLDLFYPPFCVGCGQIGTQYCPTCRESALLVVPPLCPLCGRPQSTVTGATKGSLEASRAHGVGQGSARRVTGATESQLCDRCASRSLRVDGIRSVALFEGALREAIHWFKYRYARDVAIPLGEMLIAFWQKTPLPADVIVPVPLYKGRLRQRGYNQAVLLAERLESAVRIPVVCDVLYRNRHTVSQTRLSAEERSRNVEGAFSCYGSGLPHIQKKNVLLVDDVCTTGATLEACSVALKEGGAQSVWALTVARAMMT